MTIAQIIITSICIIFDFILTMRHIWVELNKDNTKYFYIFILHLLRMMFIYGIIVSFTIKLNILTS